MDHRDFSTYVLLVYVPDGAIPILSPFYQTLYAYVITKYPTSALCLCYFKL